MTKLYIARQYWRDEQLVSGAEGLKVDDIFSDTEAKRGLLLNYGYENLFGPKGKRLLLTDKIRCTGDRVGKAFKKTYYNARKRLTNLSQVDRMGLKTGLPARLD